MINYTSKDIINILKKLKFDLGLKGYNYFNDIIDNNSYVSFTCPFHSGGHEKHPSCSIVLNKYKEPYYHCFTCNSSGSLTKFIADCFDEDLDFGEQWLEDNSNIDLDKDTLPELALDNNKKPEYLDEKILDQFNYYHPYMEKRKLTKPIIDKFKIGYDPLRNAITFPVWDENNNLIMITSRSTNSKHFYIEKNKEKPLYLLNFIKKENITTALITEAQIDSLTSWSYGMPSIATFGGISSEQIKILNKSGIRVLILGFDNDAWGDKFAAQVEKEINPSILTLRMQFPKNKKDINDLTKEEFWQSLTNLGIKNS